MATETGLRLRVRHGVYADPLLGHRAVREVNGKPEWVGPWTTPAKADAIAASQARLLRDALTGADHQVNDGDTPLDIWIPATATQTPQEAPT